jgi:uncharacterized protein (DUF1330 family)
MGSPRSLSRAGVGARPQAPYRSVTCARLALIASRELSAREAIRRGSEPGGTLLAAYVIYQGDVVDPERYEAYKAQVTPSIAAAGGRYLVRGGAAEALEGDLPCSRTVVVEFPTKQAALEWYWGEDYTAIRKLREGAARATLYVVDGTD